MTSQRETIFRVFFESESHLTVEELHDRVRKIDSAIAYSTVWRTMKLICDIGLAEKKYFGDGVVRYDRVTSKPHGHLVCNQCGATEEFFSTEINRLLHDRAEESGMRAEELRIEVIGACLKCRERGATVGDTQRGDSDTVIDIRGARKSGAE
ncbi:MAG TPA: transcriptional repressor [candidate division Zixibacteria bacterium]|nr:transcriptional repressor [candidate division Zixibacteria bacterium]